MQLHYSLKYDFGTVYFKIISQEELYKKYDLCECNIGPWFVRSRSRPQLDSEGIYIRGHNISEDIKEVHLASDYSIKIEDARRALETFILIKDERTRQMYERIN